MRDLIIVISLLLFMLFVYTQTQHESEPDATRSIYVVNDEQGVEDNDNAATDSKNQDANMQTSTQPTKLNRTLPSSFSHASNLLKNGDFESNLTGWSYDTGVYWSDNGGMDETAGLLVNPPQVESETRIIYSKAVEQCVQIRGTSTFAAEANFRYLDALPARPSVNRIHLYWYDSSDCSRGGQYGGYIEPSLEKQVWQKVRKRNLKPALGARSAQIRIEQRQDGNNNAEAIWDNVMFVEQTRGALDDQVNSETGTQAYDLPLGENYILNSTFDSDLEHWRPARSKRLQWKVLSEPKHQGVMAATLPNSRESSMGTGSFNQCVNFGLVRKGSGQRYEMGAKVKVDSSSSVRGGGRLRATWYEGLNCQGRYRAARNHIDVDRDAVGWQDLQVQELLPRQGSKSVSIGIVHSIDGQGEHTLFWDDFYFRAY